METFAVILDYIGGAQTDLLVEQLSAWNPGRTINVLDNASLEFRCRYTTHRNAVNTGIGGGIRDCLALARKAGARRLLFIVNDAQGITPIRFDELEMVMDRDTDVVHACAAISQDTAQAQAFPWMIDRGRKAIRYVRHADLIVSLLDVAFIESFGGFPDSKGGWGYSWELAYHAAENDKRIAVTDAVVVRHAAAPNTDTERAGRTAKAAELLAVYEARYGRIPWLEFQRCVYRSHRICAD